MRVCSNASLISSWTLDRRAAQLVVVPVEETDVAAVAAAVRSGAGGIILFGSRAPADLAEQLRAVVGPAPGGLAPMVMADEEGGGVQRMANLVGNLPWPATMSATESPQQVRQAAEQVARRMAANGITVDLAPVLDLASGPGPDALHTDGPRSFGLGAATATAYGLAFAQGLEAGGVLPVVKHFPGEGAASANTDDAPADTPPLASLEASDLRPFQAAIGAGLPAIMVGNASIPGLTSIPASLSPAVISGLLRQRLGFKGLVLTDSLSANAVSSLGIGVPEAATQAVAAGADMVLFTANDPEATFTSTVQALTEAVTQGRIPTATLNAAVGRVLAARGIDLCG